MKRYIWMRVSNDKYQLPEVLADSSTALAMKCGVNRNTIMKSLRRENGIYKKVENTDEEDE